MLLTDAPPRKLDHADRPAPTAAAPLPRTARPLPSIAQQVEITPASWRDWYRISEMVARNFPLETEESLGYWLCHQLPYFRIARYKGQAIGFLHAQPRHDSGTLWVNLLAVDERYRQQGVAHRLVEHFESVCRDWGCQRIGLQCLRTNVAALSLYERHGYAVQGEATTERGMRVVHHLKHLPVHDAPPSCARPAVSLDSRPVRLAYRLLYRVWLRPRSPMLR